MISKHEILGCFAALGFLPTLTLLNVVDMFKVHVKVDEKSLN